MHIRKLPKGSLEASTLVLEIVKKYNIRNPIMLFRKTNRGKHVEPKKELIFLLATRLGFFQKEIAEYLGLNKSTVSIALTSYCRKHNKEIKPTRTRLTSLEEASLRILDLRDTKDILKELKVIHKNAYRAGRSSWFKRKTEHKLEQILRDHSRFKTKPRAIQVA